MRHVGILLGISSLPSSNGIGDLGPSAYQWIDLLNEANVRYWQILPINRLGFGNSPYQTYSSLAGDEIFISIDRLIDYQLLDHHDQVPFNPSVNRIQYEETRRFKEERLIKAFEKFSSSEILRSEYNHFIDQNEWVYNYAIYATFKRLHQDRSWLEWPEEFKNWFARRQVDLRAYQKMIDYQQFLQFIFYTQWNQLKNYANQKGIFIIGDIPYYVGTDSVECWSQKRYFLLDRRDHPEFVGGVPPDYFTATGQRWGNPIYNWEQISKENYQFWLERLGKNMKLFDVIRLDHFRAFDTYWKIPASCPTAIEGEWVQAPGYELFNRLFQMYPDIQLIAEDLGDLRPEVLTLKEHFKLPGMKIIQFAFDDDPASQAIKESNSTIVYTGTHDNQTIVGWFNGLSKSVQQRVTQRLRERGYQGVIHQQLIRYVLDEVAQLAIIPVQDILGLDDHARMNTPGTIGSPNWEWKLTQFNDLIESMKLFSQMVKESGREQ